MMLNVFSYVYFPCIYFLRRSVFYALFLNSNGVCFLVVEF